MKLHVLLQTITFEVTNPISLQSVKSCLLFDGGSQITYVSKALTDQLGLKSEKVELKCYIWSKRFNSVENLFDDNELETEQWDRTYLQIKVNSVPVIRFIDGYEHNNDTLGYD